MPFNRELAQVETYQPEHYRGSIRTLLESPPDRVRTNMQGRFFVEIWYWHMTSDDVDRMRALLHKRYRKIPIMFRQVMRNSPHKKLAAYFFRKCKLQVDKNSLKLTMIDRQKWDDVKTQQIRSAVGEYLDLCLQYYKLHTQRIQNLYPESKI